MWSWLLQVHSSSSRWSTRCVPSVPLLTPQHVLVIWNYTTTTLSSAAPGSHWSYINDCGGYSLLVHRPGPSPIPVPGPWLLADACQRCGRPSAIGATVSPGHAGTPSCVSLPGHCCWWAPPHVSLTASHAARSAIEFGGKALTGVLPTSMLRTPCSSPPAVPHPALEAPTMCTFYNGLPHLLADDISATTLRVMSANCGGLQQKRHLLLALLICEEPALRVPCYPFTLQTQTCHRVRKHRL